MLQQEYDNNQGTWALHVACSYTRKCGQSRAPPLAAVRGTIPWVLHLLGSFSAIRGLMSRNHSPVRNSRLKIQGRAQQLLKQKAWVFLFGSRGRQTYISSTSLHESHKHPQCSKGNFEFSQNRKFPGLLWGTGQLVSPAFLGSLGCTPPCSLPCMQHVDSSTGRVWGNKNLAGGQSSRDRCRCCYLHHFHVRKNKEWVAANKSQEPSSCPAQQLSQSEDWSGQGTTLQTGASQFWWSAQPEPLQWSPRREDIRIPTCHCCGSSLGNSCRKPRLLLSPSKRAGADRWPESSQPHLNCRCAEMRRVTSWSHTDHFCGLGCVLFPGMPKAWCKDKRYLFGDQMTTN